MSKKLICHIHDDIIKDLNDILGDISHTLKRNGDNAEELCSVLSDMEFTISNAISEIEEAKERGQAMEDRLIEYKDAIMGLGFTRSD